MIAVFSSHTTDPMFDFKKDMFAPKKCDQWNIF